MNIYFTASRSQKPTYGKNYEIIIKTLNQLGYKVDHSHITSPQSPSANTASFRVNYYNEVNKRISNADLVVAELSFPSTLNTGHRISLALEKGKPVIGLYSTGKQSDFFLGLKSDKFIYEEYSPGSLKTTLAQSLEVIQNTSDTRFNFLIPHQLLEYLDWVAQHQRVPRSVYLRRLIETDRDKSSYPGK